MNCTIINSITHNKYKAHFFLKLILIFIVNILFLPIVLEADTDVIYLFQRMLLSKGSTSHGKVICKGSKVREERLAGELNYLALSCTSMDTPSSNWFHCPLISLSVKGIIV